MFYDLDTSIKYHRLYNAYDGKGSKPAAFVAKSIRWSRSRHFIVDLRFEKNHLIKEGKYSVDLVTGEMASLIVTMVGVNVQTYWKLVYGSTLEIH